MANPADASAARAAAIADDLVLPFHTDRSGVSGRLVRLGGVVNEVLSRHDYPEPVSETLGQALALTALIGSALKFDGKLIVQTKSDGPLAFLVVDFESPGRLRGYASFDPQRVAGANRDQGRLLGTGHLALTIDPGGRMDRYQGIVALEAQSLAAAAHTYFRQSELLPTFIRLAVARHCSAADKAWTWRAGGLMLQYVSPVGGLDQQSRENEEAGLVAGEDAEDWQRAVLLAGTVEDHELLDPTLAPDRLLYRLFHEEGVRAHAAVPLEGYCSCSTQRVETMLNSFGRDELTDMKEADGAIAVTCEFCRTTYRFRPEQLE
jgi:molecular chaperone Hsp33